MKYAPTLDSYSYPGQIRLRLDLKVKSGATLVFMYYFSYTQMSIIKCCIICE